MKWAEKKVVLKKVIRELLLGKCVSVHITYKNGGMSSSYDNVKSFLASRNAFMKSFYREGKSFKDKAVKIEIWSVK